MNRRRVAAAALRQAMTTVLPRTSVTLHSPASGAGSSARSCAVQDS